MGNPGTLPPLPAVARVLGQFDRAKLGAAIEVMIALLDMAEPDPEAEGATWPEDVGAVDRASLPDDSEADGDETDGVGAEDEPCAWFASLGYGPGCEFADPGGSDSPHGRDSRLVPRYGTDQSLGPTGYTHADHARRWNAIPTAPPLALTDPAR